MRGADIHWEQLEHALEVGAPLRFSGSDREVAEKFCLATVVLSEKIYSGGVQGIDYEKLAQPSAPGVGRGFGGWLERAVPIFHELADIYDEAMDSLEDWQIEAWTRARAPTPKQATERQLAEHYDCSKSKIHNHLTFVDRCLAGRLRARGYVVRGD